MANEKEIRSLEARIKAAIKEIEKGEKTPKETEIGKLLNNLKVYDEASYTALAAEYRPVSQDYFDKYRQSDEYKSSPEYKKFLAEEKKRKLEREKVNEANFLIGGSGGGGGGDFSDAELTRGPSKAKELKVKQPKVKLPKAPKPTKEKGDRDRTKYKFNGELYGKGPLVLAVIRKYVGDNPKTNYDILKKAFPDELLKGYGVFQSYEKAMDVSKVKKRFFLNDDQLVRLRDKNIAICSQFGRDNFPPFLTHSKKMGFKIEEVQID